MPMFHWPTSDALREYANGDIIVEAPNIETARSMAKAHADVYLRKHRSWWWMGGEPDEDDREEINKWMTRLDADLSAEPDLATVIFIRGSE